MATQLSALTIPAMYRETAQNFGNRPAFASKNKQKVFELKTYSELYEQGIQLATALIDMGIQRGDRIGLLADNRYEWILSNYGIQLAGAGDVPRGTDVTDQDIVYILPHSDAVMVFVENHSVLEKVRNSISKLPQIKKIILMDPDQNADGSDVVHLYDLIKKGKELRDGGDRRADQRIDEVEEGDLFTLIYTSGTTGVPKGVYLTQANIISQVKNIPIPFHTDDRLLSILTVWHIFERMLEMATVSVGACTYYTNVRNIKEDMKIVRPTIMASAPRLWEMVYQGILKNVSQAPPLNRKLFYGAYFCSKNFNEGKRFLSFRALDTTGRNFIISFFRGFYHLFQFLLFAIPYYLGDLIVLSKIRAATGGALRGTISGGGALPNHIDVFFNNIGIKVLEGYGLTETSPVLAVRTFEKLVIGTVGPIWPKTEARIVDPVTGDIIYPSTGGRGKKGEIHVKGPQVMQGYYKNSEATAKVLKDGWFNTGDLGMITYNNCLKIMGRSKETIVLLGGENVEPVPIENKILESVYIEQCMVTGQDKKFLTVLIVPSLEYFSKYGSELSEFIDNPEIQNIIREEIKKYVNEDSGFKPFERIIDFRCLAKPFEVGDELTNIYKMKRNTITDKYQDLIESMYN